ATRLASQPLETRWSASEPPKTPPPPTTALGNRQLHRLAVVEPPGRELARIRAQDQPRPSSPQAGPFEIGTRGARGRGGVRVEDGELVALVLEKPGLRLDLETEPVRRGFCVASALVPPGAVRLQQAETARFVRRLLAGVP